MSSVHDPNRVHCLQARVGEEQKVIVDLDSQVQEPLLKGHLLTAFRAVTDIEDFFLSSLRYGGRDPVAEAKWLDAAERLFNMARRQRLFVQNIEEKYRLNGHVSQEPARNWYNPKQKLP